MVSHFGFELHFLMITDTGHFYILFGEISIQILCLSLNWVVCLFIVEFKSSFCILNTGLLLDT